MAQLVSGVSPPIIRSKQLHWEPLFLPLAGSCWSAVDCGLAGYQPPKPRSTALQPLPSPGRTRGSHCSCMLLMMGGETSETCWAAYELGVINLWICCISLVDSFETYNDAWTCKHQISLWCLSEIFLFLRRKERDMIKAIYWSSYKVHVIIVGL